MKGQTVWLAAQSFAALMAVLGQEIVQMSESLLYFIVMVAVNFY